VEAHEAFLTSHTPSPVSSVNTSCVTHPVIHSMTVRGICCDGTTAALHVATLYHRLHQQDNKKATLALLLLVCYHLLFTL
jgi:methylthioribose-1-phosphate isomerase